MNINLIKLLLKLKNASNSKKERITVPYHKTYNILLDVLYQEGLIQSFCTNEGDIKSTDVFLRYPSNKSSFETLKIISTPSRIRYLTFSDLCQISDKRHSLFLFTDKNLLVGRECKKHRLGGKLLFIC